MGRKIALRENFDGSGLRRLAKASKDAGQSRRLLVLAEIYDGSRRTDAARIGNVGLQVIRDWVLRFNAEGADGLIDKKPPGARAVDPEAMSAFKKSSRPEWRKSETASHPEQP